MRVTVIEEYVVPAIGLHHSLPNSHPWRKTQTNSAADVDGYLHQVAAVMLLTLMHVMCAVYCTGVAAAITELGTYGTTNRQLSFFNI